MIDILHVSMKNSANMTQNALPMIQQFAGEKFVLESQSNEILKFWNC